MDDMGLKISTSWCTAIMLISKQHSVCNVKRRTIALSNTNNSVVTIINDVERKRYL